MDYVGADFYLFSRSSGELFFFRVFVGEYLFVRSSLDNCFFVGDFPAQFLFFRKSIAEIYFSAGGALKSRNPVPSILPVERAR